MFILRFKSPHSPFVFFRKALEEGKCSSLAPWKIALIVIGSFLGAVLLIGLFICCYKFGSLGEGGNSGRSFGGGFSGGGGGGGGGCGGGGGGGGGGGF